MTEIHDKLFDTKLLSYDESTGKYAWVSPKLLTSTIYNKDGVNLDDLLSVTPAELTKMVEDILEGAPEAYDTFLEVSKDLDKNKDSITEIFREIDKRIKEPEGKKAGYVLKLDKDLNYVFAKDENTTYDLSPYVKSKELSDYALKTDIPKPPDLSGYAKTTDIPKLPDMSKYAQIDSNGFIYIDNLPPEALKDTTYNLEPYALKDYVAKLYALKTEIPLVDMSPYAEKKDLENYATKDTITTINGKTGEISKQDIMAIGIINTTATTSRYSR